MKFIHTLTLILRQFSQMHKQIPAAQKANAQNPSPHCCVRVHISVPEALRKDRDVAEE